MDIQVLQALPVDTEIPVTRVIPFFIVSILSVGEKISKTLASHFSKPSVS